MARDARATGRHVTAPRPVLVPVGVGAAYARPGEAQSCYLVRAGDRAVVLDLGGGSTACRSRCAPSAWRRSSTHLHPDHRVDLLSLRVYLAYGPCVRAPSACSGRRACGSGSSASAARTAGTT